MTFFAKSNPVQSIREHTDMLVKNYFVIKNSLGTELPFMDERQWELLRWAVEYHDIGKAETGFQNGIRKQLGMLLLEAAHSYEVPHGYLSVVMIPYKSLGTEDRAEKMRLVHAVGYHHEREYSPKEVKKQVKEIANIDLAGKVEELEDHMNIPIAEKPVFMPYDMLQKRYIWGHTEEEHEEFLRYVMLKGLLHRLDHAASAFVAVEQGTEKNIGEAADCYLKEKLKVEKRELQRFAEDNRDRHVIAIAQTGMGKTEAGLLWLGREKGFFTLPLRVSINAMFDRMRNADGIALSVKKGEVGLLHSSSLDYMELQGEQLDYEGFHEHSSQLSNKLLVTTIDQILKFPFFYRGFEKEFAALAGAKVIIDEMQAYDPKIAALIVRALELIDRIGGKFMIMTATMPKLYRDRICGSEEVKRYPIETATFSDDSIKRHRLCLVDSSSGEHLEEIAAAGAEKKVLVICNTVRRAVEVYKSLCGDSDNIPVRLLHSLFLQKDRFFLEQNINKFAKEKSSGIWVTTQLVEASLDIDFDVLFTEMSVLDSLFQRMGRCYRNRCLKDAVPNIIVFTGDISGVPYIYDGDLVKRSKNLLEPFDGKVLPESEKMKLVEDLYDRNNLEGTSFLEVFDKTLKALEHVEPYEKDKGDAQQALRDIHQVRVIPRAVFDEIHESLVLPFKEEKDTKKRRSLRRQIEQHSVSINYHRAKNLFSYRELPRALKDLAVIDLPYDFTDGQGVGLILDPEKEEELNSFMS